jgi:hypothetical protein
MTKRRNPLILVLAGAEVLIGSHPGVCPHQPPRHPHDGPASGRQGQDRDGEGLIDPGERQRQVGGTHAMSSNEPCRHVELYTDGPPLEAANGVAYREVGCMDCGASLRLWSAEVGLDLAARQALRARSSVAGQADAGSRPSVGDVHT